MAQESEQGSQEAKNRPFWMRLLGLRRGKGRIPLVPTWWGVALLFLVIGGTAVAAFAQYSMQPDFCRSCHLMEPYYTAWHESTHKGVTCTDCHFEPGAENMLWQKFQASSQAVKLVTQTYGSKPHAEVRDSSCMRSGCHEQRLLEGRVNWKVPTTRGGEITIKFDHTPHLEEMRRGKQLRCVSCHSQIVQGQHLVVTLDTCYLCHMKGYEHGRNEQTLGGCQSCHEAPKQDIRLTTGFFNHADYAGRGVACQNCHSDIVSGDGAVARQVCWTCHNDEKLVQKFDNTTLLHQEHVSKNKVECANCHIQIEHGLDVAQKRRNASILKGNHPLVAPDTCTSCHEQSHGGPAELYLGTGARGVPDMPSPMSRAQVDCIACHKGALNPGESVSVVGQTFVATEEACAACHDSKYKGTIATWKQQIAVLLDKAERAYGTAKLEIDGASASTEQKANALKLLEDAAANIRLVKLGHGVHNVNYATAALSVAIERCAEATRLVSSTAEGTR